ncbi:DUF1830 domain-containing protein [Aerosakkonemataceae cyanobacterium BLCC-F50]|uniref:DUF1830 domain-containing protein n=1 Tax=Floridaenema flaviceps BLCC-F50 TaxID=3153642 RepID=A0ABV4XSH7_9CYAN
MFTSLPPAPNYRLLCYYANPTQQIQIIRITNIPNWRFEKVVFPQQRLMFEAFPEAILEVHTGFMGSAILLDEIPCHLLCIKQEESQLALPVVA